MGTGKLPGCVDLVGPGMRGSNSQQVREFMDGNGIKIIDAGGGWIGTVVPGGVTIEDNITTPGGEIGIGRRVPGAGGDTTLSTGHHVIHELAGPADLVTSRSTDTEVRDITGTDEDQQRVGWYGEIHHVVLIAGFRVRDHSGPGVAAAGRDRRQLVFKACFENLGGTFQGVLAFLGGKETHRVERVIKDDINGQEPSVFQGFEQQAAWSKRAALVSV